jgi:hypothetical protein
MYKDSVPTTQKTQCFSITRTIQLMLLREIVAVYSENHTEHVNIHCGQNVVYLYS